LSIAFKENGSKGVSTVMAGLSIATVLGVPLTTYAAEFFNNWQASFFLSTVISMIAFLSLLFFVPSIPGNSAKATKTQFHVLKDGQLWLNLVSTVLTLAAMFSSYSYLAAYLEKITKMDGTEISIMLLLFGIAGIFGNWIMGIALGKKLMQTSRLFFVLLISVQLLAYYVGDFFTPMVVILSFWGLIHTGGFLVPNLRTTHSVPKDTLEICKQFAYFLLQYRDFSWCFPGRIRYCAVWNSLCGLDEYLFIGGYFRAKLYNFF
jgi:Arabinose efflux permease